MGTTVAIFANIICIDILHNNSWPYIMHVSEARINYSCVFQVLKGFHCKSYPYSLGFRAHSRMCGPVSSFSAPLVHICVYGHKKYYTPCGIHFFVRLRVALRFLPRYLFPRSCDSLIFGDRKLTVIWLFNGVFATTFTLRITVYPWILLNQRHYRVSVLEQVEKYLLGFFILTIIL